MDLNTEQFYRKTVNKIRHYENTLFGNVVKVKENLLHGFILFEFGFHYLSWKKWNDILYKEILSLMQVSMYAHDVYFLGIDLWYLLYKEQSSKEKWNRSTRNPKSHHSHSRKHLAKLTSSKNLYILYINHYKTRIKSCAKKKFWEGESENHLETIIFAVFLPIYLSSFPNTFIVIFMSFVFVSFFNTILFVCK